MTSTSNTLNVVLKRLPGTAVLQWAGVLVLMSLAAVWLQIPDSHVWEFAFSIVFAVLIALAAVWLYGKTVRFLLGANASLMLRILAVLVFVGVWLLLLTPIAWGREKEQLLAGFLNSKLPASMRYFFTYGRLLAWQEFFYDLLQWVPAGLLLPPVLEITAFGTSRGVLRQSGRVWRSGVYWLVVIATGFVAVALTRGLIGWTPGKGAAMESISLLARLGVAYTVDILLWCFVLVFAAARLGRSEINREVV